MHATDTGAGEALYTRNGAGGSCERAGPVFFYYDSDRLKSVPDHASARQHDPIATLHLIRMYVSDM